MSSWIEKCPDGVILRVRVKPRASRDAIEPPASDHLPVRLTAPPVESRANRALVSLLAKKLKVAPSSITIRSGQKSRNKALLIHGRSKEEVEDALGPGD